MSLGKLILPELDDEMARTRTVLAAVPSELMSWQPRETMRSIGWNANHLAEIIGWTVDILEKTEFDIAPVDGPAYETPNITDPHEIVTLFDAALVAARESLLAATDATFSETWTMKMGGQTLFTMTKGDCFRRWVINHTVHHRAILSVYLRMQGVELAGVYDS